MPWSDSWMVHVQLFSKMATQSDYPSTWCWVNLPGKWSQSHLFTPLFKNLQWPPMWLKDKNQTHYEQMIWTLHSLTPLPAISFPKATPATSLPSLPNTRRPRVSESLHLCLKGSRSLAPSSPSVLPSSHHLSELFSGHPKTCTHPLIHKHFISYLLISLLRNTMQCTIYFTQLVYNIISLSLPSISPWKQESGWVLCTSI